MSEYNAVMEIRDDWWYYGMWYVYAGPSNEFDWMALIWKECKDPNDENHNWKAVYRFRYYKSDKVFDSDDERSIYRIEAPKGADLSKLTECMHQVASLTARKNKSKLDFIPCENTGEVLMKEIASGKWEWMHTKKLGNENELQ